MTRRPTIATTPSPSRSTVRRPTRRTGLATLTVLSIAALVSMGGCMSADAGAPPASSPAAVPAGGQAAQGDTASLRAQIDEAIGDANCTADSQCHALAIGSKACGGPESYVAYSAAVSDAVKLQQLGEAYAAERRRYNEANRTISNCMMLVEPAVGCRNQRCVTLPGVMPGRVAQ